MQTFAAAVHTTRVPAAMLAAVHDVGERERTTLFMTLLTALAALLARYSGQGDVVVGAPIANRQEAALDGLIGFFVNTLVLRGDLRGEPTFRELLGRVRATALAAHTHQDVPFEKLVEELALDDGDSRIGNARIGNARTANVLRWRLLAHRPTCSSGRSRWAGGGEDSSTSRTT